MLAGQTEREVFESMLNTDKQTYQNLVKIKALIEGHRNIITSFKKGSRVIFRTSEEANKFILLFNEKVRGYNLLKKQYEARQIDYRTNKTYQLGKSITEFNDKAINYFKGLWNALAGSSLSALPAALVIPVSIVVGSTILLSVIAYFVYKYNDPTNLNYNETLRQITELGQTQPELAQKLADQTFKLQTQQIDVKEKEAENGFFSQTGQGVKVGIIGLTLLAGSAAIYKLAKTQNWI